MNLRRFLTVVVSGLLILSAGVAVLVASEEKGLRRDIGLPAVRQLAIADSLAEAGKTEEALARYHLITEQAPAIPEEDTANARAAMNAALLEAQICFNAYSDYGRELSALKKAEKIAARHSLSSAPADFLLGTLYFTIADQNNAPEYFSKGAVHFTKVLADTLVGNSGLQHYSASNLILYADRADVRARGKDALQRYFASRFDGDGRREQGFNARLDSLMGLVREGRNEEAMGLADAMCGDEHLPMQRVMPGIYFIAAQTAAAAGQHEAALGYLKKSESLVNPEYGSDMQLEVWEALAEEYRCLGDEKEMGRYAMKASDMRKRLTSFSQISSLKGAEIEDEISTIRGSLDEEREKSSRQRTWIAVGAVALAVALAFITMLAHFLRRQKESNRVLYRRYVDLLDLTEKKKEVDAPQDIATTENPVITEEDVNETAEEEAAAVSHEKEKEIIDRVLSESPELYSADFSAASLSVLTGIKPRTLTAVISEEFGTTFRNLINSRRVREVCRRLECGTDYDNLTVDAIAESVGIKSRTTFSTAFKQETGMTPAQYIKFAKERKMGARN